MSKSINVLARKLCESISDNRSDYDSTLNYNIVMDRRRDLLIALDEHDSRMKEFNDMHEARQLMENQRRNIIDREWENADLVSDLPEHNHIDIESDGWEHDGRNSYSRVYYISLDDQESIKYRFSIDFEDRSTKIADKWFGRA